MITPSITETQVFAMLRAFLLTVVDCEVIRLPANRVAMPVGDFVSMSPSQSAPLSTNVTTYGEDGKHILRPTQITIQADCYGPTAGDRATAITTLFRDAYGCDAFSATNLQPLYASDVRMLPIVDGEAQYLMRASFDLVMQANPVLAVAQQSATALQVGLLDVDRVFPP